MPPLHAFSTKRVSKASKGFYAFQLKRILVINVIEAKSWNPKLAIQLKKLITDPVVSTEIKFFSLPLGIWGGTLGVMFRDDVHKLIELFQEQIAVQNEKRCRTEDELDYKMEIMDSEMQVNRAFMNLHVMIVST